MIVFHRDVTLWLPRNYKQGDVCGGEWEFLLFGGVLVLQMLKCMKELINVCLCGFFYCCNG